MAPDVMVEGDLKLDRCLMAVGDLGATTATDLVRLAGEYEIALATCDNIYMAVAELASQPERPTLIVGQLEELTRENGVFFPIAARNGARCCCRLKANEPSDCAAMTVAVQKGARLISGNGDLAVAIGDWLAAGPNRAVVPAADERECADEDFRTTQAELSALLGQELDG
jgi:hypothetical protein